MKCLRKIIIGFGIFLPVLLSALFVSPSYATDVSYTFDSSNSFATYTFCSWSSCSGLRYLTITPSSSYLNSSVNWYFQLQYFGGDPDYVNFTNNFNPALYSSPIYLTLPSGNMGQLRISFTNSQNIPSDFTLAVVLSDTDPLSSSGSCPECEVCQVCPVVPENPYDEKLDNITMAIYTCGGILLVLYFFYCIYRMIIKNSGVNNL